MGFITIKLQTSVAPNNKGYKSTRDTSPHCVTCEHRTNRASIVWSTMVTVTRERTCDKPWQNLWTASFIHPQVKPVTSTYVFIGWSQTYDESFLMQIRKFNPMMCLEGRESEIFVNRTSIYYPKKYSLFSQELISCQSRSLSSQLH